MIPAPQEEMHTAYDQPFFMKATVLMLSSTLAIGSNYCYHNPGALKNQLQEHFSSTYSADEYEILFNMLYSLYAMPNIVLPFFGGVLVDRFGPRRMLLCLTLLIFSGQSILAFGSSISNFKIMLMGRIIYGIGGESLGVARSTFVSSWFRKQELALALGIGGSFSGLAGILNTLVSPLIADALGVSSALWLGSCICFGSVCAALVLIPIDKRAKTPPIGSPRTSLSPKIMKKVSAVKITDAQNFSSIFWLVLVAHVAMWCCIVPFQTVASSLFMERDFFRTPPQECRYCGVGNYASYTDCQEIVPSCPSYPPSAWPLPKISKDCNITRAIDQLYCSVDPPHLTESEINCDNSVWKNGPLTQLYCSKKVDAEKQASHVMSIPSFMTLIGSPLFGYTVDHVGRRAPLAWSTAFLVALCHFLIAFTKFSITKIMFLHGFATSLFFSALWPSIPFIVEEHHIGSAYGAIIALGNLGLAIVPIVVAAVYRMNGKYLPNVELIQASIGLVAGFSCLYMDYLDRQHGNLLNNPRPQVHSVVTAIQRTPNDPTNRYPVVNATVIPPEQRRLLGSHED